MEVPATFNTVNSIGSRKDVVSSRIPGTNQRGSCVIFCICDSTPRTELREHHGIDDHRTAQQLRRGKALAEDEIASRRSKDRFKAEDDGCIRGWRVPLSPDLKCVSKPKGNDSREEDGLDHVRLNRPC